jgi:hypothetical protein
VGERPREAVDLATVARLHESGGLEKRWEMNSGDLASALRPQT